MNQHVIYIYTHDSIGLGEDGPTHQPIEQLSALRAIPEPDRDPSSRRDARRSSRGASRSSTKAGRSRWCSRAKSLASSIARRTRRADGLVQRRVRARRSAGRRRRHASCSCRPDPRSGSLSRAHQQLAEQGVPTRVVSDAVDGAFRATDPGVSEVRASRRNSARLHRSRASDVMVPLGRDRTASSLARPGSARARRTRGSTRSSGITVQKVVDAAKGLLTN